MIGRNAQEKSGGTKKTTAIGGVRVGKTLKYPIGTEVAYLACDLDITEDKAWAKSEFPDTWQTHSRHMSSVVSCDITTEA